MYATISDLLLDLFGIYIPLPVQTFGFFLGLSFLGAYWATQSELKRKENIGVISSSIKKIKLNEPISAIDFITTTIISAFVGFKFLEMILDYDALVQNPQLFLLSAKGSWFGALVGGAYGYYTKYKEAEKIRGKEIEERNITFHPYQHMGNILAIAGIVGIIGPNGAGKSTIFRMIMGEEKTDAGEFSVGDTVKIAYVDQAHSNIDSNKSIWENFCDGQELIMMGGRQVNSRAYLSRFNFGGSDQNKKVSALSGGERNRLHLAMTLKEEGNVLLLDEPTNDLDINTLRALEEGLENFAGCAVVISHDRWFLDRICTHILAFEGNSEVYYFEGGFSEYEENKRKRLGVDATPKRIKYRKLIRN